MREHVFRRASYDGDDPLTSADEELADGKGSGGLRYQPFTASRSACHMIHERGIVHGTQFLESYCKCHESPWLIGTTELAAHLLLPLGVLKHFISAYGHERSMNPCSSRGSVL